MQKICFSALVNIMASHQVYPLLNKYLDLSQNQLVSMKEEATAAVIKVPYNDR